MVVLQRAPSPCQKREGVPSSLSVFVCFFRICKYIDPKTGERHYSHALTWAVADPEKKKYYADALLERDSPEMILKAMKAGTKGGMLKDKF